MNNKLITALLAAATAFWGSINSTETTDGGDNTNTPTNALKRRNARRARNGLAPVDE